MVELNRIKPGMREAAKKLDENFQNQKRYIYDAKNIANLDDFNDLPLGFTFINASVGTTVKNSPYSGKSGFVVQTVVIDDNPKYKQQNAFYSGNFLSRTCGDGNWSDWVSPVPDPTTLILKKVYPVGSYYFSSSAASPADLFGFGKWERVKGRMLVGVDENQGEFDGAGKTGGSKTETLSVDQMPSHTHAQNAHQHTIHHDHGGVNTSNAGGHRHNVDSNGNRILVTGGQAQLGGVPSNGQDYFTYQGMMTDYNGDHSHWVDLPIFYGDSGWTTASNQNTGGGRAHNNLPPYLAVYIWKRTA